MRQFTHGSLFSGIGGFDLGFERAGFKTVWQVEIDEYCRRVLERRFPGSRRFADICAVGARHLEPVTVISGGFPCQDISLGGNGVGLAGERSGLYREMLRLVRVLRPEYVVMENVAALLGRGLGNILGELAEIGYDAEWDCLPAFAFGAEHMRDRILIVAYPLRQRVPVWSEAVTVAKDARIFGQGLGFAIGTEAPGLERRGAARWSGNIHGIPRRVDRIRSLGNAVVPQIAEWIAQRIKAQLEKEEIGEQSPSRGKAGCGEG